MFQQDTRTRSSDNKEETLQNTHDETYVSIRQAGAQSQGDRSMKYQGKYLIKYVRLVQHIDYIGKKAI